jgi:hypothetical protein
VTRPERAGIDAAAIEPAPDEAHGRACEKITSVVHFKRLA